MQSRNFLTGALVFLLLLFVSLPSWALPAQWRQQSLDRIYAGAERSLAGVTVVPKLSQEGQEWQVHIEFYLDGRLWRFGRGYSPKLMQAAELAGFDLMARGSPRLNAAQLQRGRLLVTVKSGTLSERYVSYEKRALEIVGDVTALRVLNRATILEAALLQRDYLLRQMDPKHYAFYKLYDANLDQAETALRTTYTASALWTLLALQNVEVGSTEAIEISSKIKPIAEFLLSMQAQMGHHRGAFHYSYDPVSERKELRFVVGTTSKAVYTLLELHRLGHGERYLDAAELAGLWLASRVRQDGRVYPVARFNPKLQAWRQVSKQSVLYSSETLSALSQLQAVRPNPIFEAAANRIAERLLAQAQEHDFFIGDNFRQPNSISTAWLAMSLLDFSKVNNDPRYVEAIFKAANTVVGLQLKDPKNVLDYGRYQDTFATSGNGWNNEVMVRVYERCLALKRRDCKSFGRALTLSTRWLIQNIYRPENSFHIINPARAQGGSIRNSIEETVRTDAVCHGGNSLAGVLKAPGLKLDLQLK